MRSLRSTSTSLVTPRTSPIRQTRCARCLALRRRRLSSMLGGKGFKGMLGSKTAYLSRSALPKDVDNPMKLRTLSSRMQNAFNELLDKHCVTNELDNGGEIMKP